MRRPERTEDEELQIYIGIDPGASGGIALLDEKGAVVWVLNMPDTDVDLLTTIMGWEDWAPRAVTERVHGGIGRHGGASGMFNYGRNYGAILMALTAAAIPFDTMPPQQWQKVVGVTYPKGATQTERKNISKRRAQQLFPRTTVTHAIADALLLAETCRRIHAGEHRRTGGQNGEEEGSARQRQEGRKQGHQKGPRTAKERREEGRTCGGFPQFRRA